MPYSYHTYDRVVEKLFRLINPKTILDIGCGAGKYGALAKSVLPNSKCIGIEIEESYIQKFGLDDYYSEIRIGDAQTVLNLNSSENFDLVIFGDSIEHMPKSSGLDILNFLTYRSQYILVLAPEFIIQHEVDGVAEEAHISVWSERDFEWHDRWAWENCWRMNLILLRGYLEAEIPLDAVVDSINSEQIPLTAGGSKRVVKKASLKLVAHERHEVKETGERKFTRAY